MSARTKLRCAIYTRKSSEEGLEQDYNSLHAQRDACEAYVKSQVGEGWTALPAAYDDGGISGGTMEREGLRRLLKDIADGKIDVVVVYKVDRLTRALNDFARIVEIFDKHGVSFVSVTQAFNTTTSMGRLTLNVLLSFAQFEREVTGSCIRDKIAASKAKGLWMGGNPPLGYDPKGRSLAINGDEADLARHLFTRYLELGSVHVLRDELEVQGRKSKAWISTRGQAMGGLTFSRGALFHLLKNPIYVGDISHKGVIHPGVHEGIIDRDLFERVQKTLKAGARRHGRSKEISAALLKGRIFDADGSAMSPTVSLGRSGKSYRYYVSTSLQQGLKRKASAEAIQRIPAAPLEAWVRDLLARLIPDPNTPSPDILRRIEVHARSVQISLDAKFLAPSVRERRLLLETTSANLREGERLSEEGDLWWLHIPTDFSSVGGRMWVTGAGLERIRQDRALIQALKSGHRILQQGTGTSGTLDQAPANSHDRTLVRLAFLAPDIQQAIMEGRQPAGLCLEDLRRTPIPLCWEDQRRFLES